jgi:hypothetical protein
MPNEMEGQELIREIAAVAPQVRVLLTSGHTGAIGGAALWLDAIDQADPFHSTW